MKRTNAQHFKAKSIHLEKCIAGFVIYSFFVHPIPLKIVSFTFIE